MIAMLSGKITYHGLGFVLLEVNGIGFKVILPEDAAHALAGETTLYTHEVIRDTERELFGFISMAALELFWKLIAISGIGPRSAQKVVFADPVDRVKEKIMKGDIAFLTDIPGVGKKTAQKIILELKGSLVEEPSTPALDDDAVEALMTLGYLRREAERALSDVGGGTTEERVREVLKGKRP